MNEPTTHDSSTTTTDAPTLTDKQQRILRYLREKGQRNTYFKSRRIGDELGMTAKEVGANITAIANGEFDIDVEKWGYSTSTTWKVTT